MVTKRRSFGLTVGIKLHLKIVHSLCTSSQVKLWWLSKKKLFPISEFALTDTDVCAFNIVAVVVCLNVRPMLFWIIFDLVRCG